MKKLLLTAGYTHNNDTNQGGSQILCVIWYKASTEQRAKMREHTLSYINFSPSKSVSLVTTRFEVWG